MTGNSAAPTYESEIRQWQQDMDTKLRADDGWLTLTGLHWLHEGTNTLGSDPLSDVVLPDSAPAQLGVIEFAAGQAALHITADAAVTVDGEVGRTAALRHDHAPGGASLVQIGSVAFFLIERNGDYAIRVRDRQHPALQAFTGRQWFPTQPAYRVVGQFAPHAEPRVVQVVTSSGHLERMTNVGRVLFTLNGQSLALEALEASAGEIWFVFKDATSGHSTYGGGRFLNAMLDEDGRVDLDFNKAYHPPCAFTPFATCPRPLPENCLTMDISAGERY